LQDDKKETIFDYKSISFGILSIVLIFSYAFWTIILLLFNTFTYNPLEYEDTSAKFHNELKIIGVPEPLRLVTYDLEKGIRRKTQSKLHLTFDYKLPKEEVFSYYQKNLLENNWQLVWESNDKWVYEKENYQITLVFSTDKLWKLDMNFIE